MRELISEITQLASSSLNFDLLPTTNCLQSRFVAELGQFNFWQVHASSSKFGFLVVDHVCLSPFAESEEATTHAANASEITSAMTCSRWVTNANTTSRTGSLSRSLCVTKPSIRLPRSTSR